MLLGLEELKQDKTLLRSIDWEMTPQEAFQAYQIKSPESWKHRGLREVVYFLVSVFGDKPRVLLVKKNYRDSQELAALAVPEDLVRDALGVRPGRPIPYGQYPINETLKAWLKKELNL